MINALKCYVISIAKSVRRVFKETHAHAVGVLDKMDGVVASAVTIQGWIANKPAKEMANASYNLIGDPTIVEIGVFMGRSTVLLAAPRRLRGCGKVHSVDAFDCTGDEYSTPYYVKELESTGFNSLENVFRNNILRMKLGKWVEVHRGTSREVASKWTKSIDLLLLDGDHSPLGAREAYELWVPFLKKGGTLILQNTADRIYAEGHSGNYKLSIEEVIPPLYSNIRKIEYMTIAIKDF